MSSYLGQVPKYNQPRNIAPLIRTHHVFMEPFGLQWIQKWWREPLESADSSLAEATVDRADVPQSTLIIKNVRLAHTDNAMAEQLWTVECRGKKVKQVSLSDGSNDVPLPEFDAKGSLLLPSLCHSHIHLDKCFILDRCKCEIGCVILVLNVYLSPIITKGFHGGHEGNSSRQARFSLRSRRPSTARKTTCTRKHRMRRYFNASSC